MIIFSPDSLRQQVEASTGGKVTVLYNDKHYPSYMCIIPKFNIEDVTAGAGTGVHPMFIVDGVEKSEIFIGQYPGRLIDGRIVSLPGVDPSASFDFDDAMSYCRANGNGWHMMTNAEWAGIFLWSHGALGADAVHGNTDYGRDHSFSFEMGRRQDGVAPGTSSGSARILTGSGPAAWRHDGTYTGIADLVGNIWEWVAGLRIDGGEIQILENNNAAMDDADHSSSSSDWQALLEAGTLVAPGTADTLKYDATGAAGAGEPVLNTEITSQSDGSISAGDSYKDITASVGVTAPDVIKSLGLFPHETDMSRGTLYIKNEGERLPVRGGIWNVGGHAGLAALYLHNPRSRTSTYIGVRPAFFS
jgi:hypothetical protein